MASAAQQHIHPIAVEITPASGASGARSQARDSSSGLERVACNLCGSQRTETLFTTPDPSQTQSPDFAVVRCQRCGLDYVNPRPAATELGTYYAPDFVSYQFRTLPEDRSLRQAVVAAIARMSARAKVKAVEAVAHLDASTTVLDIGCGTGGFLAQLRDRHGCRVQGLDFGADAVSYCRDRLGLDVIQGEIAELARSGSRYDVITMWHYLEHDADPAATLRLVRRLLADDGVLLIEVPNGASLENALLGKRSYLYDPPRHLYHFSPATLSALLAEAGFCASRPRFPLMAGGWVGSLQRLLTGDRVYRRLARYVFLFLALADLALPLDALAAWLGRGSILQVSARKSPRLVATYPCRHQG